MGIIRTQPTEITYLRHAPVEEKLSPTLSRIILKIKPKDLYVSTNYGKNRWLFNTKGIKRIAATIGGFPNEEGLMTAQFSPLANSFPDDPSKGLGPTPFNSFTARITSEIPGVALLYNLMNAEGFEEEIDFNLDQDIPSCDFIMLNLFRGDLAWVYANPEDNTADLIIWFEK